jgi:DNA-binding SARP family transcriptional activator
VFSLKLLGGAALEKDGVPVTGRAVHRRRLALLAVLAAARGRTVGRERIVGYLWPDHPGDAARHLLSESLYILRKAIGESAFIAAGDELGLDPAVVRSDVFAFDQALENDDPARAVAAYGGPFLDGFYVADAPEFERWAEEERRRLDRAHARALEALAEAHEAEGDPLAAAEWWRRLARNDPFSSRIALRLMRALEAGGERAAALRHSAAHAGLVREELGTEPDPEIEALAQRLRETPRPAPAPPPLIVAPRHAPAAVATALAASASAGGVAVMEEEEEARAPAPVERAAPRPAPAREERPARRRRPLTAVAIVAAMAISLVFILQRPSPAGVDASSYIVLPFVLRSGGEAGLTPDQAELLLHTALSRWSDVQLVDAQRARDLLARHGAPETLSEARKIAREAGAGRLLWGEITPLGDSVVVRAALYDVARSRGDSPGHVVRVGRDLRGVSASMGELASALLGRQAAGGAADASAGTRSLAAWQAYERGRLALSRWDLERARDEFAQAASVDPGYAAAHLWLAQAEAWQDELDRGGWRAPAARAAADSTRLSPRERSLARALVALGDGRFPDACRAYETLLRRDSADFAAWFGVGECNRRDLLVVADPASPSGWRYRGSFHRAVEAYGRALRTVPSSLQAFRGAGFSRINQLLNTDERVVRYGTVPRGADTLLFAGYPFLQADTIAVVPWPAADVMALKRETIPLGKAAAAERNRRLLRDVLVEWVRAFPQNPDAHEALAVGLESMGEIRVVRQGQPSAFSELRHARELSTDRDQRLRLAVAQVRLYLRVAEHARARALADSVIAEWREPGARDAGLLAPLALLAGRVERAGELLRASAPEQSYNTPDGRYLRVPVPVAQAHADALLFSGLGLAREAAEAEARLERLVAAWAPPAQRPAMRSALLSAPRRLGFPHGASRARSAPLRESDYMVGAQQMLARGDVAGARAELARWYGLLGTRRPGDVTLDFAIPAAQLSLSLGDTARAVEELDRALLALEAVPMSVLDHVHETSALLRAMQLRAAIASARGDRRTAAQWRAALSTLWAGGDPRLRAMLR